MKKGSLSTVFLVVLVDLMGFGIVLPLMPFYAGEFQASPFQVGLLYSIYSLAQLFFTPIWGAWSDKIGRRPIMLLSTFGASMAYIIFGFAGSLSVLFFSRLLAGVMGGNISAAMAYITDITTFEKRAQGMGIIGAAFGIGFMIGPAVATGLIHPALPEMMQHFGFEQIAETLKSRTFEIPAFFAAATSFISFLLVIFKLPESLPKEKRGKTEKRITAFNPQLWKSFAQEGQTGVKGLFILLLISIFVLTFGNASLFSSFPLFCEQVMHLSADRVGVLFSVMGLIAIVVQGGLIRPLSKRFAEERIFVVGNIIMFAGMLVMGLSASVAILMTGLCVMAAGNSLSTPTINSLFSKEADPKIMGTTMGVAQSVSGFGRVVGPAWGGFLFEFHAYMPFWATTAVLLGLVIFANRFWNIRVGVNRSAKIGE